MAFCRDIHRSIAVLQSPSQHYLPIPTYWNPALFKLFSLSFKKLRASKKKYGSRILSLSFEKSISLNSGQAVINKTPLHPTAISYGSRESFIPVSFKNASPDACGSYTLTSAPALRSIPKISSPRDLLSVDVPGLYVTPKIDRKS